MIAVCGDVRDGVIVGEKKVFKTERAEKYQTTSSDSRLPRALNQQWMSCDDRGDAAKESINRADKCQKECK